MARLPNSRDIGYAQAPSPQGVVRLPVPERGVTGQAIADVGTAAHEIITRLQDAQTETEVRSADASLALDLDKARRDLLTDPDFNSHETKFQQAAKALIEARTASMSQVARQRFQPLADDLLTRSTIAVRDGARKVGVEQTMARVYQQSDLVKKTIDDEMADPVTRARVLASYITDIDSKAKEGFIGQDDAARMIAEINDYSRVQNERRSLTEYSTRRADEIWTASKGDMTAALAAAAAETSTTRRLAIESRLNILDQQKDEADRQARNTAGERIWEAVRTGKPISEADAQAAPQTALAAQDYVRNRARERRDEGTGGMVIDGKFLSADAIYTNLRLRAGNEPSVFLRADLQRYRGALGEARYLQLAEAQIQMRDGGGGPNGATTATLNAAMAMAKRSLETAGYNLSSKASDKEIEKVDSFQADLLGRIDAFVANEGRQPNPTEQRQMVDELLAGTGVRRGGLLFLPGRELRETDVYVPYNEIPEEYRQAAEERLKASNRPVTRAAVEQLYRQYQMDQQR